MTRMISLSALCLVLAACQPAAPPQSKTDAAPVAAKTETTPTSDMGGPAETNGWVVNDKPVWSLVQVWGSQGFTIECEEGKKQLRISFFPAWEGEGRFDKAVVKIGDKRFDAAADPKSLTPETNTGVPQIRPVYVLPANADTVSAFALGTSFSLALKDGSQEQAAQNDTSGAFDMFATTCAQINGLR